MGNHDHANFYAKYKQAVNDRDRNKRRPASYSKSNLTPPEPSDMNTKAQVVSTFYGNIDKTDLRGRRVSLKDHLNYKQRRKHDYNDKKLLIKQSKM